MLHGRLGPLLFERGRLALEPELGVVLRPGRALDLAAAVLGALAGLVGLAQGGRDGVAVAGIGPAAGERHLPSVRAQGAGPLGEQHVRAVAGVVPEEDEDGAAAPVGRRRDAVAAQGGRITSSGTPKVSATSSAEVNGVGGSTRAMLPSARTT